MKTLTRALLMACSLMAVSPSRILAQAPESFSDSFLTGEQWRQRLEQARRRSEEFVASARAGAIDPASEKPSAEAADQRAMNDPSLQRGDIVATTKGFFVFVGSDSDERRPENFLPATTGPSISMPKPAATTR